MGNRFTSWLLVIIGLVVVATLTKPSPEDIMVHVLNKCASPKEKMSLVQLVLIDPNSRNSDSPLSNLVTFLSDGKVVFRESPLHSWVEANNKVVAYAALGMYKVPTCEQLRSKQ